jgi:hypothetical protein
MKLSSAAVKRLVMVALAGAVVALAGALGAPYGDALRAVACAVGLTECQ